MKQTALLLVAMCVLAVSAHAQPTTNPHFLFLHIFIGETSLEQDQTQTLIDLTNLAQAAYDDIENIPNDVVEKLLWALYCQWAYLAMHGGIPEELLSDVHGRRVDRGRPQPGHCPTHAPDQPDSQPACFLQGGNHGGKG